jgi:hypothetical protein
VAIYVYYNDFFHTLASEGTIPRSVAQVHRRAFIEALLNLIDDPEDDVGQRILDIFFNKCMTEPIWDINSYDKKEEQSGGGILWKCARFVSIAPKVISALIKAGADPKIINVHNQASLLAWIANDFCEVHRSDLGYWTDGVREIVKLCRERGSNFMQVNYMTNGIILEQMKDMFLVDVSGILNDKEREKLTEMVTARKI